MKSLLIGSVCYKSLEQCNDIDIICDQEFFDYLKITLTQYTQEGFALKPIDSFNKIIDCTIPEKGSAFDNLLDRFGNKPRNFPIYFDGLGIYFYKLPIPYNIALKKAHLINEHRWFQNIDNYKILKELMGVKAWQLSDFTEDEKKIFKKHREECLKKNKHHPVLKAKKDDFFKKKEEYNVFQHDDIHIAIADPLPPAYTLMIDGEVWCSKQKWNALSHYDKLRCFIEEASILALERSIIPHLFLNKGYAGIVWAYNYALMKVCTTITSGFFREWCIEHYHEAKDKMPDISTKFFDGLKEGKIRKYDDSEFAYG